MSILLTIMIHSDYTQLSKGSGTIIWSQGIVIDGTETSGQIISLHKPDTVVMGATRIITEGMLSYLSAGFPDE